MSFWVHGYVGVGGVVCVCERGKGTERGVKILPALKYCYED